MVNIRIEIFHQDNEFKIKTLEKMPVFGIFVPLSTTNECNHTHLCFINTLNCNFLLRHESE